jgi:glycosyltransferase involved in cell wall biosynthesis
MDAGRRVNDAPSPRISVGIALASRRDNGVDVSDREDADLPLERGGELPFEDRAVASLHLGDAAVALPLRDQVELLLECRRVMAPAAEMLLVEPRAAETFASLARWAALVGLVALPADARGIGWHKYGAELQPAPLVSIVIPSSNPRYFLECLDSAIAQTYRNIEIVICDDCGSRAIADLVASRDSQLSIRYEKNPERLRTRRNYEKCLAQARGEYIKFLNDDDVLEPDCVGTLLDAFLRVPDLALATSHRLRIDAASRAIDDIPATRPIVDRDVIVDGVSLANAAIMYGLNFIGEPSTALFRKRDFGPRPHIDGERPFNFNGEEVRGAVDFAMWSRLLVSGNAAFFHRRLSRFRSHAEQAQARSDVVARSIVGIRALQRKWIELGLFRRWPPHVLQLQPFPRPSTEADEWRLESVQSLPPNTVPIADAVTTWRNTTRHSFDLT